MKRLITFICLIVIAFLGYHLITSDVDVGSFNIGSYNTIETKSNALTKKLANYDKKNESEYETAVKNLNSSVATYKDAKARYEAILSELSDVLNNKDADASAQEVIEETIYSDQEKYKVDFLLVTLGDYGEKEGVDVVYQLTTSSTVDQNSSTLNYFLSDLKFTVTGQYMSVANFISDLENDDRLSWEIKDFAMGNSTNGKSGVTAAFTVKDVPIDTESYLESTTVTDPNTTGNGTTDSMNPDGTATTDPANPNSTTDPNAPTDTNTVSNTTPMTTNTVSNTVTNQTSSVTNTVVNNTVNN